MRACTMQAAAAAAGVSKATLYNYFRTKDELARALQKHSERETARARA